MSDSMARKTSGRVVQPIGEVPVRLPTHGRIRTGQFKSGSKFPTALKKFRFTSEDKAALEYLANIYGGEVQPWANPKANPPNQFELLSHTDVVAVSLVPASVKLAYEKWGNGFLNRRCDGTTVIGRKPGGKGKPVIEQVMPCICNQKQQLECNPVTRLNVVIPGMTFKGTWMLQSNGWNVFSEMPGVAALIESMATGQLVEAKIRLAERQADGGARKFVVPVIELTESLTALAEGKQAALMAEASDEPPALAMAADPLAALEAGDDDDVVEGEIVDD